MTAAPCGQCLLSCSRNKKNLKNLSIVRVTDRYKLTQALVVDPLYLQHSYSESAIDYRVSHFIVSILNIKRGKVSNLT